MKVSSNSAYLSRYSFSDTGKAAPHTIPPNHSIIEKNVPIVKNLIICTRLFLSRIHRIQRYISITPVFSSVYHVRLPLGGRN